MKIFYRVHVCGGDWLLYVTGYDVNDDNNGYADNDQKIDAVEVILLLSRRNAAASLRPLQSQSKPAVLV